MLVGGFRFFWCLSLCPKVMGVRSVRKAKAGEVRTSASYANTLRDHRSRNSPASLYHTFYNTYKASSTPSSFSFYQPCRYVWSAASGAEDDCGSTECRSSSSTSSASPSTTCTRPTTSVAAELEPDRKYWPSMPIWSSSILVTLFTRFNRVHVSFLPLYLSRNINQYLLFHRNREPPKTLRLSLSPCDHPPLFLSVWLQHHYLTELVAPMATMTPSLCLHSFRSLPTRYHFLSRIMFAVNPSLPLISGSTLFPST